MVNYAEPHLIVTGKGAFGGRGPRAAIRSVLRANSRLLGPSPGWTEVRRRLYFDPESAGM